MDHVKSGDRGNSTVRLLVGFSGSVATIKDRELVAALSKTGKFEVRVVYTHSALHFKSVEYHES